MWWRFGASEFGSANSFILRRGFALLAAILDPMKLRLSPAPTPVATPLSLVVIDLGWTGFGIVSHVCVVLRLLGTARLGPTLTTNRRL